MLGDPTKSPESLRAILVTLEPIKGLKKKENYMETPAFIYAVFLWFLLLSVTGYSIYVGFGPGSKELKDPFEEHED
jgi:PsbN protein